MSRQIKVRHFGCSQLQEDTFKSSYWVTRSLYGNHEVRGRPRATTGELTALLATVTSSTEDTGTFACKEKKKLVFYSPVLGLLLDKSQREVSFVTASCYT